MRRYKRIHKRLEIRPPPLGQGIADNPVVVDRFAAELGSAGGEAFVQARFEAGDFVVFGAEVVAGSVLLHAVSIRVV